MEAQGRRFSGVFPGYDGPAPPRAMRSSRGRGEAARRQTVVVPHKGRFELLATVAGRILQDTGVNEGQDKAKANEHKTSLKENSPSSEIDSQVSSVGSAMNHIVTDKAESANTVLSVVVPHVVVVVPGQSVTNEEELQVAGEEKNEGVVGQGENSFGNLHSEAAVCSLSQEEQSMAVERVTSPVDQDTGAPVNIVSSTPADQELLPPPCYSDLSTAKFDPTPASPSVEIKEITSIELLGRCTEMQQYQERFEMIEMVSEQQQIMEDKKQQDTTTTLGSVGTVGSGSMDFELPLMAQEKLIIMEKNVVSVECCKENRGCSEAMMGEEITMLVDGPATVVNEEASNSIPEFQSSESGDVVKLAGPSIHLQEEKDEENASVEMEDKGIVVNENTMPSVATSGCSKVASSGRANGRNNNSRPMLKRVMCKRDVKLSRTKKMNPSKHVLQETMTKKLKDSSYNSKGLDAQKVARAVKCSHLSKTSTKRNHTDMESTDSGSSEEAGSEKETLFGGIAGLTWQRRTRRLSSKRKKTAVDGTYNPAAELHLNNVIPMEMGYEYVDGEPPAAAAKLRSAKAASVASSPTAKGSSKLSSKKSLEAHSSNTVTLSIKSFLVPELFVDLPESASILNLKRAVMEAAMNLLGGGLRVRVLLQGKKVPDEGLTLLEMGISHSTKPESLGFMLEPSPLPTSSSATAEDPLLVLSHAPSPPLPRYPVFGAQGLSGSAEGRGPCTGKGQPTRAGGMVVAADPAYGVVPPMPADEKQSIKTQAGLARPMTPDETLMGGNGIRSHHLNERMTVSAHSTRVLVAGAVAAIHAPADTTRQAKNELNVTSTTTTSTMSQESFEGESGAIVLHPSMGAAGDDVPNGMALVPVRQKMPCALEVGKRRMRRPFSVAEVEALVHAVEKLGTGRWRDVKLRAFDQAKHRTYVDLKDKWKTLVHTARIAPHQRRGEPVPQELLERVIQAHSYWTAQAAKQQAERDS